MSLSNLEKALELAKKCDDFMTTGGVSSEIIQKSEELLQINFSIQNRIYYERVGYLSFFGCELFEIAPFDDLSIPEVNSIAYAINDRKEYNLPKSWLPFYNYDDGYMAYLDYDNLNSEGEPRVILSYYNGDEYIIDEILSDDLGNFMLEMVEDSLEG